MTCVVGVEHKGKVWIGADSAGTDGSLNQTIRADKKVFIKDNVIIGFAGSFRAGQILHHKFEVPKFVGKDVDSYMVNEFIDALKSTFKDDMQEFQASAVLVGFRGKLNAIFGDFQVGRPQDGFDSIGSGANIAKGAMSVSKNVRNQKKRIIAALEASASGNAGVRPPFTVLHV